MLKIYCALSAECAPDRAHSTKVPSAGLHRVWSCCLIPFSGRGEFAVDELSYLFSGRNPGVQKRLVVPSSSLAPSV